MGMGATGVAAAVTVLGIGHETVGEGVKSLFAVDKPAQIHEHPRTVQLTDPNGTVNSSVAYNNATRAQQAEADYKQTGELEP